MNKRDFFIEALKAGKYTSKDWVLEAFSITRKRPGEDYHYKIHRDELGYFYYSITDNDLVVRLDDSDPNEPLFDLHANITINIGDIPNLTVNNLTTTYGNVLFNYIVLVYPFGDKIDFMADRVNPGQIEAIVEKRMINDDQYAASGNAKLITVSEYLKFGEAVFSLAGYTQLCVPSATAKTMTTDPRMNEFRAKFLAENEGHLNDPIVIAKIDAQLVEIDREWMRGDEGEGFYIGDKSYNVVRKKLYGMLGGEDAFGDGTSMVLIQNSLNDGWDINQLPTMGNSLREGSYNRGALTELGGAITKEINRYSNNSSIIEKDCGSTLGLSTLIKESNKNDYLGNYFLIRGENVLVTDENVNEYVGEIVNVRSPVYCKTAGVNYCAHCAGERLAETPNAIGVMMSDCGSQMLAAFLALMHGRKLAVAHWDYNTAII
jgi:hypothetical protein